MRSSNSSEMRDIESVKIRAYNAMEALGKN